jgi:hypothetical protein
MAKYVKPQALSLDKTLAVSIGATCNPGSMAAATGNCITRGDGAVNGSCARGNGAKVASIGGSIQGPRIGTG